MATITISGLPEISTIQDYTNIPVETVGITQRITGLNLKGYLAALPALTATSATVSGTMAAGLLTANSATISGALQTASISANTGVISGLFTTNNLQVNGLGAFGGNVSATNFIASQGVYGSTVSGLLTTAAQPNITSVGTLTGLAVSSTINGSINGTASSVTGAAQPNITSVGTLTGLSVSGTATINTLNVTTLGVSTISPTTLSATTVNATNYTMSATFLPTSNGTLNLGGPSNYFATIFGQATTAKYADLAECYEADAVYAPGTVLVFGDKTEVTMATSSGSVRVAGVVTTQPAHLMNDGLEAEFVAKVALTGRVPCKVVGTIKRGDMLVTSALPGVAQAASRPELGSVIGKALANYDSTDIGVIEVVVGRL